MGLYNDSKFIITERAKTLVAKNISRKSQAA